VEALREQFGFPGMRVLQFAFGQRRQSGGLPSGELSAELASYTRAPHDNDTTVGWFHSQSGQNNTRSREEIEQERRAILAYLKSDGHDIHWDLTELAFRSNANTAIVPLQDIMGLGSEARMNVPGVTGGNWQWRFTWDMLTPERIDRLRPSDARERSLKQFRPSSRPARLGPQSLPVGHRARAWLCWPSFLV